MQQVLAGFFGVAVSAYVASRTGQAEDFFVIGIAINVVYGLAYLISILVRWPLLGLVMFGMGMTLTWDSFAGATYHTADWPRDGVDFILLNPGAFTHTSVALRDALLAVAIPFIEIHLSNTFAREEFRHNSYFSDIAAGCVIGLGALGYELALQAAAERVADTEEA